MRHDQTADGATDRCQHCGLPIKDAEDWGWIVYPASLAHSDEAEVCFGNAGGHSPVGGVLTAEQRT